MNKILIVDASVSDIRVMSNLLSRAGYAPLGVDSTSLINTNASSLQQWLARYIYQPLANAQQWRPRRYFHMVIGLPHS